MNTDHENKLEARIDRELKALPPLAAPPTLAPRVMAALAACAAEPWYRRAWQTWSLPLRAMSFAILLAMFGGFCFGSLRFAQSPGVTVAREKAGDAWAGLGLVWKMAGVLGDATLQVMHHLHPLVLAGLIAMAVLGYALMLGIGAAGYRLAFARK